MQDNGVIFEFTPPPPPAVDSQGGGPAPLPLLVTEPAGEKINLLIRTTPHTSLRTILGSLMIIISLFGMALPFYPRIRLDTQLAARETKQVVQEKLNPETPLPPAAPKIFNPLITESGEEIVPINTEFAIIVPRLGINANVVPSVDPLNGQEYSKALEKGVAHAKTSYLPDQEGTTYLFSHSTNYEWFVEDLNAIFYSLKNLEEGDVIVIFYKGIRYTYEYTGQQVVSPSETSFLVPETGDKRLILQTCWPPGSVAERLLIFAELIDESEGVI